MSISLEAWDRCDKFNIVHKKVKLREQVNSGPGDWQYGWGGQRLGARAARRGRPAITSGNNFLPLAPELPKRGTQQKLLLPADVYQDAITYMSRRGI